MSLPPTKDERTLRPRRLHRRSTMDFRFCPQPKPVKRGPKQRKPLRRSPIKRSAKNRLRTSPLTHGKPTKALRPSVRRRNETKRKDKAFQIDGETNRCEACGKWAEQTTWHHRKGRRFRATRWDPRNCWRLCFSCHESVHRMGEAAFVKRCPHLSGMPKGSEPQNSTL